MKTMKRAKAGFTLMELMMSLPIGILVLGTVMTMLVQVYKSWRDGVALWYLSQEARIARERILRGLEGQYGLREASYDSVSIQSGSSASFENLEFDSDSTTCQIEVDSSALSVGVGAATPTALLNDLITDQELLFTLNGITRTLVTDLTLSVQMGGKTYVHKQRISTYMLND